MLAGCGKKEVKSQSVDSKLTLEAFALAEDLKKAYEKKDLTAFEALSTPEGFAEVSDGLRNFDRVELDFTPRWVEIEGVNTLFLNVSWVGTWTFGDRVKTEHSMAVFKFEGTPLRLLSIPSGSPFVYP